VVKKPFISLAQDRESSPARTNVLTTMLHLQPNSQKLKPKAENKDGFLGKGSRSPGAAPEVNAFWA